MIFFSTKKKPIVIKQSKLYIDNNIEPLNSFEKMIFNFIIERINKSIKVHFDYINSNLNYFENNSEFKTKDELIIKSSLELIIFELCYIRYLLFVRNYDNIIFKHLLLAVSDTFNTLNKNKYNIDYEFCVCAYEDRVKYFATLYGSKYNDINYNIDEKSFLQFKYLLVNKPLTKNVINNNLTKTDGIDLDLYNYIHLIFCEIKYMFDLIPSILFRIDKTLINSFQNKIIQLDEVKKYLFVFNKHIAEYTLVISKLRPEQIVINNVEFNNFLFKTTTEYVIFLFHIFKHLLKMIGDTFNITNSDSITAFISNEINRNYFLVKDSYPDLELYNIKDIIKERCYVVFENTSFLYEKTDKENIIKQMSIINELLLQKPLSNLEYDYLGFYRTDFSISEIGSFENFITTNFNEFIINIGRVCKGGFDKYFNNYDYS